MMRMNVQQNSHKRGDKGGNDTMFGLMACFFSIFIPLVLFNSDNSRRSMYLLQECFIYIPPYFAASLH